MREPIVMARLRKIVEDNGGFVEKCKVCGGVVRVEDPQNGARGLRYISWCSGCGRWFHVSNARVKELRDEKTARDSRVEADGVAL